MSFTVLDLEFCQLALIGMCATRAWMLPRSRLLAFQAGVEGRGHDSALLKRVGYPPREPVGNTSKIAGGGARVECEVE